MNGGHDTSDLITVSAEIPYFMFFRFPALQTVIIQLRAFLFKYYVLDYVQVAQTYHSISFYTLSFTRITSPFKKALNLYNVTHIHLQALLWPPGTSPISVAFQWCWAACCSVPSFILQWLFAEQTSSKSEEARPQSQFLYGHPAWLYNHFTTLKTKQKNYYWRNCLDGRKVFSIWP